MLHAERVLDALGKYIFGEEVGDEGTPHLQGAVSFQQKTRFTAVKKLLAPSVHWEKMKAPWARNVAYCVKEANGNWAKLHGNVPEASRYKPWEQLVIDQLYKNVVWRTWQQDVIDIINGPIDSRKIYWFWEPDGNSGKSFLVKWLFLQYRCILGGGKMADVFHQVTKMFEAGPLAPTLVLLDIPRSSLDYCNYGAIEKLKDGMVAAGKYDGGQFDFLPPHVLCFANEEPAYEKMSEDRWAVKRLRKARTVNEALKSV